MSDSADDHRPRPRYGEYATPEEQRARIRVPDPALMDPVPHVAAEPASAPSPAPVAEAAGGQRRGRLWDRLLTWALLGYGFITVLSSVTALMDYGAFAATFLEILGVDAELADPSAGTGWGIGAAVVLALGWILTAVLSWFSLRAGRISFWIPLVGGAVFNMASGMLMLVPIMSDPTVWDALIATAG
ncbi:DUF6264 family protein [Microbacterium thalassium]|uniref:Uncharacterized protein n=1 Tax=Microbacterium thalassium TaxID=362649 RepID=A0A7X0FSM8_9MICO|nr:DUF6264 family protein [Microbacterium thalassium]MBB6392377.1 hypothetical protein [Microbacterium thalassium]GLK25090.1 hypothetical protein GCM10017607_24080 [Microbacterium thalassium]